MTADVSGQSAKKSTQRHIPNYLVSEVIDGIPFYYRMVISATPADPWQFYRWDQDVALFEAVSMNVGQYLAEEGIDPQAGL